MIQDIAPHIFNNSYKPLQPKENDALLLFRGREVMVAEEESEIRFPRVKDFTGEEGSFPLKSTYFFSIDNTHYFGVPEWEKTPPGFKLEDINLFREGLPKTNAFAGVTGFSLANWYAAHRFCGRCGQVMQHHPAERMMQCPACKQSEYPKISPAVIVGVTNGNKLLLTKYANRPYTNYALIAGFTEIGESIEDTVRREVMEEAGVKVKNITFYKSQPWGFTDCLLMGFFAELEGNETITMDKEELSVAEWVEKEQIPPGNASLSLTGEMIEYFRNNENQ